MAKSETNGNLVYFNHETDEVEVYVQVFYGYDKWKLGVLRMSLAKALANQSESKALDQEQLYAYFAYCILSGQIFGKRDNKDMAKSLAYDPSSILEKSNLTTRVTKLVGVLRRNQVSTKATFTTMLQSEDKQFLLDALQPWYKGGRSKIETLIKNL